MVVLPRATQAGQLLRGYPVRALTPGCGCGETRKPGICELGALKAPQCQTRSSKHNPWDSVRRSAFFLWRCVGSRLPNLAWGSELGRSLTAGLLSNALCREWSTRDIVSVSVPLRWWLKRLPEVRGEYQGLAAVMMGPHGEDSAAQQQTATCDCDNTCMPSCSSSGAILAARV